MTLENFDLGKNGLSVLGMDVVPSSADPNELFVYLINYNPRLQDDQDPSVVGTDVSVEIFKTTPGGTALVHLRTVQDSSIIVPNDVTGSPDGKYFYFTNSYNSKTGFVRTISSFLLSVKLIAFRLVN